MTFPAKRYYLTKKEEISTSSNFEMPSNFSKIMRFNTELFSGGSNSGKKMTMINKPKQIMKYALQSMKQL